MQQSLRQWHVTAAKHNDSCCTSIAAVLAGFACLIGFAQAPWVALQRMPPQRLNSKLCSQGGHEVHSHTVANDVRTCPQDDFRTSRAFDWQPPKHAAVCHTCSTASTASLERPERGTSRVPRHWGPPCLPSSGASRSTAQDSARAGA